MKTILFSALLSASYFVSNATDYYSQTLQSDPNALASWNTIATGGGAAPASFTNSNDRFIIQAGHTLITTNTWTIGSATSVLIIESGATLKGDHIIQLTGTFQIDNGGTYIHNNTGNVSEAAGNSIFSGTETFNAGSNFEIRYWPGKDIGLPGASPGIVWGNLIVNLQTDMAGLYPWNWNIADGDTLTVIGNLDIRATYVSNTVSELRLTPSGIQMINVGGDFLISGKSKVAVKSEASQLLNGYTTMQVNGSIIMSGLAQLEIGINTTYPFPNGLYELRFKGDFSATGNSLVLSSSGDPSYLVANGSAAQNFTSRWFLNCNFRVATGAIVNMNSSLTMASYNRKLSISGILNQKGYPLTVNGKIECAGGVFSSSGNVYIGRSCIACSNLTGTYDAVNGSWCTLSGTKGKINFTGSTITLENVDSANLLSAGSAWNNSPGDIYFTNSTADLLTTELTTADYLVHENSVFSIDGGSYIAGSLARYAGMGGILRIGSPDGITALPDVTTGNIRTGAKEYDNSGINNFEYFGATAQVTGKGLPLTIVGTLRINNKSGLGTSGVSLSQHTTIKGTLALDTGKLSANLSRLITIANGASVVNQLGSFVDGYMKKVGNTNFLFPVGEGNEYGPVQISGTTSALVTDAFIAKYYRGDPGTVIGPQHETPPIDHISNKEWWTLDRIAGSTAKTVTLYTRTYSDATALTDLRVLRWSGSIWMNEENMGSAGSPAAGYITSDVVTDFFSATPTPFTLGSASAFTNPLPLELISFNATKLNSTKAAITWQLTAYSSFAAKFEIQRAGADKNFTIAGAVSGSETSLIYTYTDNGLKNGVNYYRLKMTDETGTVTYSRTVAVMNGIKGLLLTSLIPTVVTDKASLTVVSSAAQKMDVTIVDMQGRLVGKQNYAVSAGNTTIAINMAGLGAGVYQLTGITLEGKTNTIRFIKQ